MADRNVEALINPLRFGDYAAGNYVEVGADGILKYFGTAKQSQRKAISIVALDYETADLTTGAQKYTMRMPYPMELTEVRANVRTAPAGADLVVDINQEGTSVLTTPVSIDQEVKSSGSVELTAGTDGEVSSVTVDGVVVTSGAVLFNTDLTTTAADLAANITAFTSVPNYTATSALGVVTIVPDTAGDSTNGFVVTPVTTLTLTATAVDLAGGVTEKTSTTSATPAVIGTSALADDAEITIDIDQVGSTAPGQGLKIHLIGYLV